MNAIFIGGSRHISRLPPAVKKRIDNVVTSDHHVLVGDANGADKAVQKHLLESRYDKVTVFCSSLSPRNNLGNWPVRRVSPAEGAKGFHLHAAKDREMAREADFGLMIWDGKSPGTVLNVLRLTQAGKISVLFNAQAKVVVNVRSVEGWRTFLAHCTPELRADLKERATPEELAGLEVEPRTTPSEEAPPDTPSLQQEVATLNQLLALGDAARIVETLGAIARHCGMSQVARRTGLARESLYRSLDADGNPEFATVVKVLSAMNLRLEAKPIGPAHEVASVDHAIDPAVGLHHG